MALIDKLKAIADAIRTKTKTESKMTLEEMATAVSGLKTEFLTQDISVGVKEATGSGEEIEMITPEQGYDGIGTVYHTLIPRNYIGKGVRRVEGGNVTPTKDYQDLFSGAVYVTSGITVLPIPDEYIIPSGSQEITQNDTYDVKELEEIVVNVAGSGGLPAGFKKIATGTYDLASAVSGTGTFVVDHNLGEVPDLFLFYHEGNVAQTYSMLYAFRSSAFNWRSSSYLNLCGYHGNSSSTVTCTNVTTTYGIKALTATQATVTTYGTSTSYYWRAGTYKWIAIKFA